MPHSSAASVRLRPSSTRASANIRRAASASRDCAAARRSPVGSSSVRVIKTPNAMTLLPESGQSKANHGKLVMGIPRESETLAVGISTQGQGSPPGSGRGQALDPQGDRGPLDPSYLIPTAPNPDSRGASQVA